MPLTEKQSHRQRVENGAYLLDGDAPGLRNKKVHEEDGNKLPESKEDVDAPLQGAQHVQKSCTQQREHVITQWHKEHTRIQPSHSRQARKCRRTHTTTRSSRDSQENCNSSIRSSARLPVTGQSKVKDTNM